MRYPVILFRLLFIFIVYFFSCVLLTRSVSAQNNIISELPKEEVLEATVERILDEKEIQHPGMEDLQLYQKLELIVTKGSLKNKLITIENGNIPLANFQKYKIGDRVIINFSKNFEGKDSFYISDYIRRNSLLQLFIIFLAITLIIAGRRGLSSLLGMGVSFLVIFVYILPKISTGSNPVQVAIIGSLIIIPITFFLSHGFNKKTFVAIVGTIISLVITGFLANIYVDAANLTGFASEEASFLQITMKGLLNMKGLLLAGIIIGILGVLDDITISQSAIVFQLKEANSNLNQAEIYKRAMSVGQDHISSLVNTLILVYTGAALPLLLLFIQSPNSFSEIINYEIVADEVVRTLVGSIGLILAVPITTIIASIFATQKKKW